MFTQKNLIIIFGKHAIIALVSIAVAVAVGWFLSGEIGKISDSVVKNRDLAEKLGHRTELFSTLARDVAVVGENEGKIEHAFIPADDILEYVSALKNVGLKNAATPTFQFSVPVASPIAGPFPISSIDYQNGMTLNVFSLITYLKNFEQLPYFTKINSLGFTSQSPIGWRGEGAVSFSATLYTKTNQ